MRLRTHRLWLASLLVAAGLSTQVGAKPPDLPVQVEDQLTPANTPPAEVHPVPVEATVVVPFAPMPVFRCGQIAGAIVGHLLARPDTASNPTKRMEKVVIEADGFEDLVVTVRETETGGGTIILGSLKQFHNEQDACPVQCVSGSVIRAALAVADGCEEAEEATPCPNVPNMVMPCRPGCPATGVDPHAYFQKMTQHMFQQQQPQQIGGVLPDDVARELAATMFAQAQKYVDAGQYAEALQVYASIRCVCPNTPYETQAIGCMNAVSCMMSEKADGVEASEPATKPTSDECPYLHKKLDKPLIDKAPEKKEEGTVVDNIEKMEKAAQLYKKAEQMMHDGDCDRAAVYYERIQKLVPNSRYAQMAADRLTGLSQSPATGSAEEEVPPPATGDSEDSSLDAKQTRLEKNLDRLVTINFYQTPLVKCIEDLRSLCGIDIQPDRLALAEEGISLDSTVTVRMANASVNEVLDKVCQHVGLDKTVKDGTLYITSRRVAEGPVVTACYDITDLLKVKSSKRKGARKSTEEEQAKKLMKVITETIQPKSWVEQGGIGSIEFYPLTKSIVVNHTPTTQEMVEEVLAQLREQPALLKNRSVKQDDALVDPVETAELLTVPSVKLVPMLPAIDPTIVQAYEEILEMQPPRCLRTPCFGAEACEPMTWVPLKPMTPDLSEEDVQKLLLAEEECELEVLSEENDKTSSMCVDLDLQNARGKRMKIELQMGRLNLKLVRDAQGHGTFTIDYTVGRE